jgi:hypothetical protein
MVGAGVGALRALRALVFLAATLSLTAAGHVVGGGSVSVAALVGLVVVAWPVALLGSRRRRDVRHLFPALVAGQLAGHAILQFLSGPATTGNGCSTQLAHHGTHVVECGEPLAAAMTGTAHAPVMTGAHLLAALALAVVMAKGEAMLWRIVDLVAPTVPRVAPLGVAVPRGTFFIPPRPRRVRVLTVPGRGPPVTA